MINLPKLQDADVAGKRVLVRADVDVGAHFGGVERLRFLVPTLEYLAEKKAKVVIIGHNGRPEGEVVPELSLMPVGEKLKEILALQWGEKRVSEFDLEILENLRFNPNERANNLEFAKELAKHGDFYVNESFANSHREHASIVSLPKLLPHACGIRFCEEVENLQRVFEEPKRPVLALVSGVKEDKLSYINDFKRFADKILIGGRLPDHFEDSKDPKLLVARLVPDKEDITLNSVEAFEEEIAKAATIVLSGPVGRFEDEGHRQGTERVLKAIAKSSAFKVAGGGDTRNAISTIGVTDAFDWISVGGGAMLDFLAHGTLPGIEALIN